MNKKELNKDSYGDIVLSKETIQRLIKDVKDIMKNPLTDNGIYYHHDEEDMLRGYAMIVGPSETPYYAGYYLFELVFPPDYPHSPPKVTSMTQGERIRFNPNMYATGKVCISILNTWTGEQWTSCQTISTVLLTLCTLLCKDPLLNEPGITINNTDMDKYTRIIEYYNIEIALLRMLRKEPTLLTEPYQYFYPAMVELWEKNKHSVKLFIEEKCKTQKREDVTTICYSMRVEIYYKKLYKSFMELYNRFSLLEEDCVGGEKKPVEEEAKKLVDDEEPMKPVEEPKKVGKKKAK
jgi:ubiquitin-conjugating enzyme E2 Z